MTKPSKFHGTLGGKILLIILLSITLQLSTRIYDRYICICQIHLDIFSAVSHHTCCEGVLKPPHVVSYVHTFYRTEVWYLRKCRTIVTQHNWVWTIYHHKLLVTYFDRMNVFYPLATVKRHICIVQHNNNSFPILYSMMLSMIFFFEKWNQTIDVCGSSGSILFDIFR